MIVRQFQNLCGVMVYDIVIKLSLASISIPEDKEKRFDYNICEALNDRQSCTIWNSYVIDVMLLCHSFIVQMFELLIWIGKDIE